MRKYEVIEYDREDYDEYAKNITKEQVIESLERIECGWLPDYNYSCDERDFDMFTLHMALMYAIEAINKVSEEVSLD